jgi:hypothetical protein
MGRRRLDSATQVFTFSVDGQMGKTGVHSRYKRGRDFYLDYDLLVLNATTLELRDHLTGEHRTFRAEARLNYVEPAIRRIPKPADEGRFQPPLPNNFSLHPAAAPYRKSEVCRNLRPSDPRLEKGRGRRMQRRG